VLGGAFDYAVNTCKIPGEVFVKLLAASSVIERMENGEPTLLAGKSGIELASDIAAETLGKPLDAAPVGGYDRSSAYWIGWAAAYYQWRSGRSFSEIFKVFTYDELEKMYYTLHEADISKFADIADERMKEFYTDTNLKRIRTAYGCSQAELAKMSGVNVRSIQMYEQRNKDINKANAETLCRISKVLGCKMEDLIEK